MPFFYLEPSALLKRYKSEAGSEVVDELFTGKQADEAFLTSFLTVLEVTSVAARLRRGRVITEQSYRTLLADFSHDVRETIIMIPVTDSVLSQAVALIGRHGLRAADSVHLATAESVMNSAPGTQVVFLASDAQLKRAAGGLGLTLLDPEKPEALSELHNLRR